MNTKEIPEHKKPKLKQCLECGFYYFHKLIDENGGFCSGCYHNLFLAKEGERN